MTSWARIILKIFDAYARKCHCAFVRRIRRLWWWEHYFTQPAGSWHAACPYQLLAAAEALATRAAVVSMAASCRGRAWLPTLRPRKDDKRLTTANVYRRDFDYQFIAAEPTTMHHMKVREAWWFEKCRELAASKREHMPRKSICLIAE